MHKKKYHSLIVLIPSFNELHNLKKFIIKLNKYYKVLIVDDCSSDNSSIWLRKNKINFIKNKFNLGYEQSLIKGFKYIIRNCKIKKIITMKIDSEPNTCTAEYLKIIAIKNGYSVDKEKNIQDALKKLSSKKAKTICVFGSLYHVGYVLSKN